MFELDQIVWVKSEESYGKIVGFNLDWTIDIQITKFYHSNLFGGYSQKVITCNIDDISKNGPLENLLNDKTIYFSMVDPLLRAYTKIPNKIDENAGYDVWACVKEDFVIKPGEVGIVPTNIASACSNNYAFVLKCERSSVGKLGMHVMAGLVDSSYRGEWYIQIYNPRNKNFVISHSLISKKPVETSEKIVYPAGQAIAQFMLVEVPKVDLKEVSYEELMKFESNRGTGWAGSTNK